MSSATPPPRRKPSPAVYRRRRLVVLVLALAVLGLLVWGVVSLIGLASSALGGDESAEPSAPPSAVSSPTPAGALVDGATESSSVDPAGLPECAPADLRLTAASDEQEYSRGSQAVLRLEVTNLSSRPCRADVGTAQQEFLVEDAGGERIMSTRVCQVEPTHEDRALLPHEAQAAVFRWDGRVSSEDCGRRGDPAEAGDHRLVVKLGELTSRPVALRIVEKDGAASSGASASPSGSPTASPSGSPSPSPTGAPAPSSGSARPSGPPQPSGSPTGTAAGSPARSADGRSASASPSPTSAPERPTSSEDGSASRTP